MWKYKKSKQVPAGVIKQTVTTRSSHATDQGKKLIQYPATTGKISWPSDHSAVQQPDLMNHQQCIKTNWD